MLLTVCLIVAFGAFLTGLSKGGLGGALGAIVTPMLALVMPASAAIGLTVPMLLVGDVFAVGAHWRRWDQSIVWRLMPSTIIGVLLGSVIIGAMSPLLIQHVLGAAALLYVVYRLLPWRIAGGDSGPNEPMWQTAVYGSITGLASTLASAGGPSMTIYLLRKQLTPAKFVATSAFYFAILNLTKIPAYLNARILSVDMFIFAAWALPLIPFGVWMGKQLDERLDRKTFENIVLIFLALTGLILFLKA